MQTYTTFSFIAAALLVGCGGTKQSTSTPEPAESAEQTEEAAPVDALAQAVADPHRSEADRARDPYRNPYETLSFCGIAPDQAVVELSPGGGWYTAILAPYLADEGSLVAGPPLGEGPAAQYRQNFVDFIEAGGDRLDHVTIGTFSPPAAVDLGEPGSADLVLTFRSAHSWIGNDIAEDALQAVYDVLRPGGTLCLVQHRAPESAEESVPGYVKQSVVVSLAEGVGFTLDASSEVNANPKDTADHPEGVWTLPPNLRLGDTDREKYEAIGESDRMTLRFVKPAADAAEPEADEE